MPSSERLLLTMTGLRALCAALQREGYQLVGPTVRDGAIVQAEIQGVDDLPIGWTEVQEAGTYRLKRRTDGALFGYSIGPQSAKQFFFPPRLRLLQLRRKDGSFIVNTEMAPSSPLALIGVRSCDLHAIEVQDRVFLNGPFVDPDYAARRRKAFVVAVNCGQAGGTCFCVSMNTGPRVTFGFDLCLTELLDGEHRFVVDVGSERGAQLLASLAPQGASEGDCREANTAVDRAAAGMGRQFEAGAVKDLLYRNLDHPQWDDVASRCLSCTNCTLVCPTCFCATVEDVTDLGGETAERWRRWDSCFTLQHSYVHGGSVRPTTRAQYRQWLVHKLATWIDQFGSSGCVGCGRCIT